MAPPDNKEKLKEGLRQFVLPQPLFCRYLMADRKIGVQNHSCIDADKNDKDDYNDKNDDKIKRMTTGTVLIDNFCLSDNATVI